MKTKTELFMVGWLSACLLGCATPGRPYEDAKVALIKKDVTTEAELLDWFGPATSRMMASDGGKMLSWRFSPGASTTKAPGKLEVRLGADGKVSSYSGAAGSK